MRSELLKEIVKKDKFLPGYKKQTAEIRGLQIRGLCVCP